jgi:hypothetical protein
MINLARMASRVSPLSADRKARYGVTKQATKKTDGEQLR